MLAPPYSSDTVMPSTTTSPILRHRSIGNWSLRSASAARGAISLRANSRTASRSASMSSPSWKFRPGRSFMVCLLMLDAFAPDDAHLGGGHGGDEFLAALVDGPCPALDDGDRTPGPDDDAFHAKE